MFVRTVRDHAGLTPPKACATINGFVEFSSYSLFFYTLYLYFFYKTGHNILKIFVITFSLVYIGKKLFISVKKKKKNFYRQTCR